jgi:translation initiation factor IF-2
MRAPAWFGRGAAHACTGRAAAGELGGVVAACAYGRGVPRYGRGCRTRRVRARRRRGGVPRPGPGAGRTRSSPGRRGGVPRPGGVCRTPTRSTFHRNKQQKVEHVRPGARRTSTRSTLYRNRQQKVEHARFGPRRHPVRRAAGEPGPRKAKPNAHATPPNQKTPGESGGPGGAGRPAEPGGRGHRASRSASVTPRAEVGPPRARAAAPCVSGRRRTRRARRPRPRRGGKG